MTLRISGKLNPEHRRIITSAELSRPLLFVIKDNVVLSSAPTRVADMLTDLSRHSGWYRCYLFDNTSYPAAVGTWDDNYDVLDHDSHSDDWCAYVEPADDERDDCDDDRGSILATKESHFHHCHIRLLSYWWYIGAIVITLLVIFLIRQANHRIN